jgi:FkbM family methyltransferase
MGAVRQLTEIAQALYGLSRPDAPDVPLRWLLRTQARLNRRFARRAVVSTQSDGQVVVNGQIYVWPPDAALDSLLSLLAELNQPEHPHQYLWGPTRIAPGDVCLDIGACEGAFAARVATLGAEVICIEPSRLMGTVIRRLFQLRGLPAPRIEAVALGPRSETARFHDDGRNPGASQIGDAGYDLRVETLDECVERLALSRLDFIKCDAEGMDVDIITSGPKTLRRLRPKIAITTYHDDAHFADLARFLTALGYRIVGKGFHRVNHRFRVVMLHAWPSTSSI